LRSPFAAQERYGRDEVLSGAFEIEEHLIGRGLALLASQRRGNSILKPLDRSQAPAHAGFLGETVFPEILEQAFVHPQPAEQPHISLGLEQAIREVTGDAIVFRLGLENTCREANDQIPVNDGTGEGFGLGDLGLQALKFRVLAQGLTRRRTRADGVFSQGHDLRIQRGHR
jgi:hypothetical protein